MSEYFLDENRGSEEASDLQDMPVDRTEVVDAVDAAPATITTARKVARAAFVLVLLLLVAGLGFFIFLVQGLPDFTDLENVNPAQATRLYSSDGQVIHELFNQNRIWITYDQIPDAVVKAALATEDRNFLAHWGINLKNVPRAMYVNLVNMSFEEGFSTITMQVARNIFIKKIGFDRNVNRKLREMMTAIQIERTYSKKEILEMYLNISYFGKGSYGIVSAARKYFNKSVDELTIEECAYLIGILKGPAYYNPRKYYDRAKTRRNQVMLNMVNCDMLTKTRFDSLKQLPLLTGLGDSHGEVAPYFTEYVRQQLNDLQKELGINVYDDGLNVFTTLNYRMQSAMDSAIFRNMPALQEKVIKNLQEWKEENEVPDSVFAERSVLQVGFVALDHKTGQIKAMVGGRDFDQYKFNRAVQAKRQPGSTFKPFLYAAAIDNGYKPTDKMLDQPVVLINPDGTRWTPRNFDLTLGGPTSLREGLRRSRNLVAAHLIDEITPRVVREYARNMGITTPINPVPSLAMGSSSVIPIEMISAFGVFANDGVLVKPIAILRIEDRYGNEIYRAKSSRSEALNRSTAYIMNNMLQDVLNRGTGAGARALGFTAPGGGKTGTTNDYTDAWFIGFTTELTAGVWVGFDDQHLKLGRGGTGAGAAMPFWADFMKTIYDDEELNLPRNQFQQPPEIIRLRVCTVSGDLSTTSCPATYEEVFKINDRPVHSCEVHKGPNSDGGNFRKIF